MLPKFSINDASHPSNHTIQNMEELNKPQGETLNEQYGLINADPREAFKVFQARYGKWVMYLAWKIAESKGMQIEDVAQHLWLMAWEAAIDDRYTVENGKSIIGWIHQRVTWAFNNLLVARNPISLLENFRKEDSSLEPEDLCVYNADDEAALAYMGGSQSLTRSHKRLEAVDLIQKILQTVQQLPYEYRAPIIELLDPSPTFIAFAATQDDDVIYAGAARFETCNSAALFKFTGSNALNLKVAIAYILQELPELKEYKF